MDMKIFNKDNLIDVSFIIFGSFIGSIGINMFLIHSKLLSGGTTGIALIFQYLFKVQAGYTILLLNIPLFILSGFKLNNKFTINSIIGTVTLSLSLIFTHPVANILHINDNLLYCLYGGVVCGLGYGLVFAHHGSTGGLDIVSMVIKKKYTNFNIGKINFIVNLLIVSVSSFIFGLPTALYTLIAMFITSLVLDNVIKGLGQKKLVFIITEKEEEIANIIMTQLNRGVTNIYGEGAYTKKQKKILYCIIPLSQLPELKKIVKTIDDRAFLTIADASEVEGKGYRHMI
ncbi:YitT family protein [Clostridium psychrophilum]|uniref:YitT family protein n=1 Tax=Clostridium psychrophilum TaxID=132926 RepID=UPI001C0B7E64|nr:YitT family protein [Clostridium psychrophilum]MBU3182343.1 YitT family protein [Clostridium psychrophilum]